MLAEGCRDEGCFHQARSGADASFSCLISGAFLRNWYVQFKGLDQAGAAA